MQGDRLRLRSAARTRALANVSSSTVTVTFFMRRDLLSAGFNIITRVQCNLACGYSCSHENALRRAPLYFFAPFQFPPCPTPPLQTHPPRPPPSPPPPRPPPHPPHPPPRIRAT